MQLFPLTDTISAREIQRGYKKIFTTVKKNQKPIVVMANNDPQAAIISVDMLAEYTNLRVEKELFDAIDRMRSANTDKDPNEVFADITQTVEDVRQRIYEKTFGRR